MILRARKPKGTSCPMFLNFYSYFCNRKYHKDLAFSFLIKGTRLLSVNALILHHYGFKLSISSNRLHYTVHVTRQSF